MIQEKIVTRDNEAKERGAGGMDAGALFGPDITIQKNGPYLVSGSVPLSSQLITNDAQGFSHHWRTGVTYPLQKSYLLCRCGKSATKPFCDGIHEEGFDGTEVASRKPYREQAESFDGTDLLLTDVTVLCSSAKFCDRAGGIWELTRHSDRPGARDIAITEASNCPSGRLVVRDKKTGKPIEPELRKSVGLVTYPGGKSGAIWVRGGIPVVSGDGTKYEIRNRVTLCRCGKSANKPFCDSSHRDEVPDNRAKKTIR